MKSILLALFLSPVFCQAQIITLVAGTGAAAYSGDGGQATAASFDEVCTAGFDAYGNIYLPDYINNRVRKIDASGVVTTVAGNGSGIYAGDGGPATDASIHYPDGIVFDRHGNMYIADRINTAIRKIDPSGIITTYAGKGPTGAAFSGDGGPATAANLVDPTGLDIDKYGNVYIANEDQRIRKVDTFGIITTIAGNGVIGYSGDGAPATDAELNSPTGVAVDTAGNVYIGDEFNHRVRKVSPSGIITTYAGTGTPGYSGDGGAATAAEIHSPWGVATDKLGNVYIADMGNDVIRRIDVNGIITTLAGCGILGYSGDGGPAILAELQQATGMSVDNAGNVYIADSYNNMLRMVSMPPSLAVTNLPEPTTEITIYPNPVHDVLTINATGKINSTSITDIVGHTISTPVLPKNNNIFSLDVSELQAGIYLVKVNDLEVRKFVKE